LDSDAPNTSKQEKRVPSRQVRWERKVVDKPEELVDDAHLERSIEGGPK
jgi:hypothetical protein